MDRVVGLPECEGFDAIWVVADRLSKWRHFIPCHTTIDAIDMAKLFVGEVVPLHGLLAMIVSDRGSQFALTLCGQVCSRVGIDRRMSTGFHTQMDGQTERMNASMEQYLRVFINSQQDDWVQWLPFAEFAANDGVLETTKCTPVFAVQGVDPRNSFAREPTKDQDYRRLNADLVEATMQRIHEHLRAEMRRSQAIQEVGANQTRIPAPNIQNSTRVWLDLRHI